MEQGTGLASLYIPRTIERGSRETVEESGLSAAERKLSIPREDTPTEQEIDFCYRVGPD